MIKVRSAIALITTFVMALGFVFVVSPLTAYAAGTIYYVDSVNGNDNNNGTSSSTPWKTLNKVNSVTFAAGSQILFKAGCSWTGQLWPKGSGTSQTPNMVGSYGTGNKPLIMGAGVAGGTVKLYNQSYWEISGLEITNTAAAQKLDLVGIKVFGTSTQNHIYIRNCDIHDVNGPPTHTTEFARNDTKKTGGIDIQDCVINDILIENNTIHKVDRTGINAIDKVSVASCTGLVIRNNTLYDIGGDGIIVLGSQNALVERNVLWEGVKRSADANAGIWPYGSNNSIFQYNECFNLALGNESNTIDSMAWDFDSACTGTIYQYNYSHNNAGGSVMACSDVNYDEFSKDGIFRYNISQNDRDKIVTIVGQSVNFKFYNNTFYSDTGNPRVVYFNPYGGVADNNCFYNNIFYILNNTAGYSYAQATNTLFDYNVFYGSHPTGEPADAHKLTSNPLLGGPGTGGTGLTTVDGYKLQAGSPCIDSGMAIGGNGGKDYWGNTVPQGSAADRGAHEYIGNGGSSGNNLVLNPGFESGNFTNWSPYGTYVMSSTDKHSGSYGAKIGISETGVEQTITGLKPNTSYTLTAWVKSGNAANPVYIGVKNFGGTNISTYTTNTAYTQLSLSFTTGAGNTSALIFLYQEPSSYYGFGDDFALVEN